MSKHKVIFTQENGIPTISVEGAKGKECLNITKEVERALGKVDTRKKTKEFYDSDVNKNKTTE